MVGPLSLRGEAAQTRRARDHSMGAFHSTLLDRYEFRHVFGLRTGGVSAAPYDTLNLGFHLGDDDAAVRENRRRFARVLGIPLDRLFEQRQVHGTQVREVSEADAPELVANSEGDALASRTEGLGVAARTADCVPVLIAHPPSGHVAAVHAGWRGAVAGVVPKAIDALSHHPNELVVAIGPHIRVGAFEIGDDVAQEMERAADGASVVRRGEGRPHGDLAALVGVQLRESGVPEARIDDVGGCTYSDAAHFFSHRRDRGKTGRHLSAIVARASSC